MLDVGFVNLVSIIAQNPKVTAINSCIEVDLTGQVVSDSIGTRMYSGIYLLELAPKCSLNFATFLCCRAVLIWVWQLFTNIFR